MFPFSNRNLLVQTLSPFLRDDRLSLLYSFDGAFRFTFDFSPNTNTSDFFSSSCTLNRFRLHSQVTLRIHRGVVASFFFHSILTNHLNCLFNSSHMRTLCSPPHSLRPFLCVESLQSSWRRHAIHKSVLVFAQPLLERYCDTLHSWCWLSEKIGRKSTTTDSCMATVFPCLL